MDRHHFVPRSEGGRGARRVHRICHAKIHSLFTGRELATLYGTPEALRAHPEVARFVRWVAKRPPEFHSRTAPPRRKADRR